MHHQAVKELASVLTVPARSEEGIMEAAEVPGKKIAADVHWHPEMMYDDDTQQGIFRTFIKACD